MKNKKSIYRILISLLGVLSVVLAGNCVFAEDAGNSDGFLRRQNMLSAFGVWQEPSEESEEITRAEFVMLIGKIFNIGESNQRYFIDVQDSHKASGIINMAFEKGIVIGYDDGLFRPENPISCDEALLITLKSLGYTEQILNSYDNSLMRSKILKDIPAGNMTWDSAFKLAENLFDVKPLVFATGEGDKHGLQESENNVWEACQGIYKMTGILELSGKFSTFYNTSKNEQIIQINGETFETDGKDYSEYFGMNVCAYYYEDKHADERTVLYMEPYGRQTKETIIAQDIISADQDCIKYELPNDSKERKIQIASGAAVVYNSHYLGDIETEYVQPDMLNPENGSVCLIDHNNDGRAEVLVIEEYDVYKVVQVGKEQIWVDGDKVIDIDEDTVIYKNNEKVSIGSIIPETVVQVYKSVEIPGVVDGEIYLRVSDNKVSGTVQALETDYIYVNDGKYRIGDRSALQDLVANATEVDVYLDSQGIAVFIEIQEDTTIQYGVPILCVWDDSYDQFIIRIITAENGVQTYKTAQKVKRISGTDKRYYLDQSTFEEYFGSGDTTKHNLIGFKLNSNSEIVQVIEAVDATAKEWGDYDQFSLDAIIRSGENGVSSISYEADKINAKYYVSGNSKAFVIPEGNSTYGEDYTVLPAGEAISLARPDAIEIYDLDEDMQVAFIVMRTSANVSQSVRFSSSVGVVREVNGAVNEDGELCYLVKIAIDGEDKEYYTENQETQHVDSVYTTNTYWNNPGMSVGELECGDAIQISVNEDGYITAFRMVLDRSRYKEASFAVASGDWTLGDYIIPGSDLGIYYGPVLKMPTESNFIIRAAGEKLIIPGASPRSLKVYLHDSVTNDVEICEWNEVQKGDYVLVVLDWRYEREIVIYR